MIRRQQFGRNLLKNRAGTAIEDDVDELVNFATEKDEELNVSEYKVVVPPPLQVPTNKQFMESLEIKDELEIERKQIREQKNEIIKRRNAKETSIKDSLVLLQDQMELEKRNSELMNTIESEMKKYYDKLSNQVDDANTKN